MSKKRPSTESDNYDETKEDSESPLQTDDGAKRAKLDLLISDTTLQDLPIELLESILIHVVAMEVKDSRLAKGVWKERCDVVIRRLQSVCSQWNNILATNFFRTEIHRILDNMAQKAIGFEILHEFPFQHKVFKATPLKDEIFTHCLDDEITVYDRNNMAAAKDVIQLSGFVAMDIAACVVSNCVYVLGGSLDISRGQFLSAVVRISKGDEHQFNISPLISDNVFIRTAPILSVSASGDLIIPSHERESNPAVVSIYSANGLLKQRIQLPSGIFAFRLGGNILEKSNGNLVLVSHGDQQRQRGLLLTEMDTNGIIVRQYRSNSDLHQSAVTFGDIHGRILISDPLKRIELLDSELNLLNVIGGQPNWERMRPPVVHYNSEKQEVMGIYPYVDNPALTIFRLTEE